MTTHTDHENLACKAFNADGSHEMVSHARTVGLPKREKNVVANVLSRLCLEPKPKSQCNDSALEVPDTRHLAETFLGDTKEDNSPGWTILVSHKLLFEEQCKDKMPRQKCSPNENDDY